MTSRGHTIQLDGRVFQCEVVRDEARDVWLGIVGEGVDPGRWSRLDIAYDSAVECLEACVGGVVRLVYGDRRPHRRGPASGEHPVIQAWPAA